MFCGPMLLLAAASVGIDFGWQPIAGGGVEYIIQIEPELLESLASGRADIVSEIPPFLQGVRSYRITVGTGPLPHHGEPPPMADALDEDQGIGMPGPDEDPLAGAFDGEGAKSHRQPRTQRNARSEVNPAAYEELDAVGPQLTGAGAEDQSANAGEATRRHTGVAPTTGQDARDQTTDEDEPSPSDQHGQPSGVAGTTSSRPWLPLGLALIALCASLAGNAYQGWAMFALRQRYLLLLARSSQK